MTLDGNPQLDGEFRFAGGDQAIVASVFTPYQLLFLERVLAQVTPRPTLIIDQRPEKYRIQRPPAPFGEVVGVSLTGKVIDPAQQALMRETLAAVERFAAAGPITFLCSSLGWAFNNAVFTRWRRSETVRFALLEDGLSTYLAAGQSRRGQLRNLAREALGRARGYVPRTLFGGHALGLDLPEVRAILVGSDLVAQDRARRYVTVPPIDGAGHVPRDPAAALFVGQPYLRDYGEAAIVAFIDKARAYLNGQGITRLEVKPHHFQTMDEIRLYLDRGFTLLDPPVTVEELIGASTHGAIASCNTTALMTSKSLLGPAIRSIAFSPAAFRPAQETRDPAEVVAVFRRFGVEVVEF